MRNKKTTKTSWLLGVAGAALCFNLAPAHAQEQTAAVAGPQAGPQSDAPPGEITKADQVVIIGQIVYRNRTDEIAPVLEYGQEYFQRFEPLTVGDALKRVPSVTFLSDVLESDGVRLRGLDPAYTQILINGDKVPGSGADSGAFGNGADGAFFVDRIPAELIDRVELVRSASANRSGDAMAGAVNIVLRDAFSLEGGYVRLGALGFDDGRIRETYGAVWGGAVGGGRLLLGANVQGRRNPKEKLSLRFDEPGGRLLNLEDQKDLRDGTDYSGNFAYQIDAGPGRLSFDGFYVKTDRTADEDSIEYTSFASPSTVLATSRAQNQLFSINSNDVDTDQTSWALSGGYELDAFGGETTFKIGYAKFENSEFEFENENEYLRGSELPTNGTAPAANRAYPEADRFTRDIAYSELDDYEIKGKVEHSREIGSSVLDFGVQFEKKERDNSLREGQFRTGSGGVPALAQNVLIPDASGAGVPNYDANPALSDSADNTIRRTQVAPFVMLSGNAGAIAWEAGLRYEQTELDIDDRFAGADASNDYGVVLPSAHVRWDLTENDRISGSVARTIRNPSFNFLSPALLEEELGDNDFLGNPDLEPEMAWGLDAGYERRLGRTGIAGVNFFYRDVTDLIEIFNTGLDGSACEGDPNPTCRILSPRNTGDGKVWGVEIDYSAPLDFIGLPDTGVFANYSWLDSEITDEFGERRFNSQSDYIYNVGFIHDMPSLGASFGVTYRKQGDAESRIVGEEVVTAYEGVLEAFIEKRFGNNFTLRLTGSNLTDGSKDEVFHKFDNRQDQVARSYAEYELETETAGPAWQLIGRYSF